MEEVKELLSAFFDPLATDEEKENVLVLALEKITSGESEIALFLETFSQTLTELSGVQVGVALQFLSDLIHRSFLQIPHSELDKLSTSIMKLVSLYPESDSLIKVLSEVAVAAQIPLATTIPFIQGIHAKTKLAFRQPAVAAALFQIFYKSLSLSLPADQVPPVEELLLFVTSIFSSVKDPISTHRALALIANLLRVTHRDLSEEAAARVSGVCATYFPVAYRPTPAQAAVLSVAELRRSHVACAFGHPLLVEDTLDLAVEALFEPDHSLAFNEGCAYLLLAMRADWDVWRAAAASHSVLETLNHPTDISLEHLDGAPDPARLGGREMDIWNCLASAACEYGFLSANAAELLRYIAAPPESLMQSTIADYVVREFEFNSGSRTVRSGVAALAKAACAAAPHVAELIASRIFPFFTGIFQEDEWNEVAPAVVEIMASLAHAGQLPPVEAATFVNMLLQHTAELGAAAFDPEALRAVVEGIPAGPLVLQEGAVSTLAAAQAAWPLLRALALRHAEAFETRVVELPRDPLLAAWISADVRQLIKTLCGLDAVVSEDSVDGLIGAFAQADLSATTAALFNALPQIIMAAAERPGHLCDAVALPRLVLRHVAANSVELGSYATVSIARADVARLTMQALKENVNVTDRLIAVGALTLCVDDLAASGFAVGLWDTSSPHLTALSRRVFETFPLVGWEDSLLSALPSLLRASAFAKNATIEWVTRLLADFVVALERRVWEGRADAAADQESFVRAMAVFFALVGAGISPSVAGDSGILFLSRLARVNCDESAELIRQLRPFARLCAPLGAAVTNTHLMLIAELVTQIDETINVAITLNLTELLAEVLAGLAPAGLANLDNVKVKIAIEALCKAAKRGKDVADAISTLVALPSAPAFDSLTELSRLVIPALGTAVTDERWGAALGLVRLLVLMASDAFSLEQRETAKPYVVRALRMALDAPLLSQRKAVRDARMRWYLL
eukprot:gnl/Chilomastix_cuspidata/2717.p1 GENE.gnl/Chilomastix_cuspidata/2717~~gnl/Chilomastix_cuspidata/2717.p1  ORF type:complete len:971 (+),score=289.58 gnl/Chilomastix_cuspidata/2717:685-3597(+)